MKGNGPAAAFLGSRVAQFDEAADRAIAIDHHVPSQVGDLPGPQPCFGRQQDHDRIAQRVPGAAGEDKQVANIRR